MRNELPCSMGYPCPSGPRTVSAPFAAGFPGRFDWPHVAAVWKKVREELAELKKANRSGSPKSAEES